MRMHLYQLKWIVSQSEVSKSAALLGGYSSSNQDSESHNAFFQKVAFVKIYSFVVIWALGGFALFNQYHLISLRVRTTYLENCLNER